MSSDNCSDVLGPVDSAFYFVDSPQTPMNIGAVTLFEGEISFETFLEWIEARIYQAPPYQKRIVDTSLNISQPRWIYDPNFDVNNHVFKHVLDRPGTDEQLRELAGHLVSGMLDRNKPLWEIHVINGLEGNRTALLFKVHHCMVDGLSAVELFTLLFDLTPQASPRTAERVYAPPPLPNTIELLANTLSRDIPNKWSILNRLEQQAIRFGSMLLDPEERRKTFVGIANLLNDNVTPIQKLIINGTNTGKMTLAWAEFSLAEVRAIRARNHCSVNEVMVTVLGAAIEDYVNKRGETSSQKFVRVLAPIDMRMEQEKGTLGNRIAVLPIDVPFNTRDPLERLHQVSEYSKVMKDSGLAIGVDMILTLPSLALNFAQPYIWKAAPVLFAFIAHTWCTNVVGPQIPIYLAGHKMLDSYGFFPLNPSMGLACVIMSYNQRISMTLIADAGIIPDVKEIKYCLEKAFTSLRAASEIEPEKSTAAQAAPSAPISEPLAPLPHPNPVTSGNGTAPVVSTVEIPPAQTSAEAAPAIQVAQVADVKPAATPASSDGNRATGEQARFKMFSQEWAQAYRNTINTSARYLNASRNWTAGPLSLVMRASPDHGFAQPVAVLLDLDRGKCHAANALPPQEATHRSNFALEGEYEDWVKVLSGKAPPIAMIMRNKLILTKGSMFKLLPYTQSAEELVNCAQQITAPE